MNKKILLRGSRSALPLWRRRGFFGGKVMGLYTPGDPEDTDPPKPVAPPKE